MTERKPVPLRDIGPGRHFYDPELMISGAVRYVGEHGKRIQVKIRRYRPSSEPDREVKDASPGWLVYPGDMPADVRARAETLLAERSREQAAEMQRLALNMRREGMPYEVIADELNIQEHQARELVRDAVRGVESEAVPDRSEAEDRSVRAFRLRRQGLSYPKIAQELGYRAPASARMAAIRGAKRLGERLD